MRPTGWGGGKTARKVTGSSWVSPHIHAKNVVFAYSKLKLAPCNFKFIRHWKWCNTGIWNLQTFNSFRETSNVGKFGVLEWVVERSGTKNIVKNAADFTQ